MMKKLIFLLLVFTQACAHKDMAPLAPNHTREMHEAFADDVMVVSQGEHTTKAALRIRKQGGNVFDMAVAASFVISVERPHSTGLGGGGFAVIDGPNVGGAKSLDFREVAPIRSTRDMYLDKDKNFVKERSLNGPLASGVPGLVKGLWDLHFKYGKLPWKQVVQPAIDLAEDGFLVYPELERALKGREELLASFPASKKIFFKDGRVLKTGELLIQEDLAWSLGEIAKKGYLGFYEGEVAKKIVSEFKKSGGLITQKDLDRYRAIWRKPIEGKYKGHKIVSMGPPSSGGAHIIQILNIVEPMNLEKYGVLAPFAIHKMSMAMQMAFIDRARYMGDSDFVKVPLDLITSKEYAASLREKIGEYYYQPKVDFKNNEVQYESPETTHLTVMDSKGNVVSTTQTINYWFGSGQVVPGTGIVMNDEMDDFSAKVGTQNVFGAVGSEANAIEPGKRPLSSMSPTLVYDRQGSLMMALGTPSGTRILTCVTQVIFNSLEYRLPLYEAVGLNRYHHQWKPSTLRVGPPGLSKKTREALSGRGYALEDEPLGCRIQAIRKNSRSLQGVSDQRGEGLAAGL